MKTTGGKLLTILRDGGARSRADLARGIGVSPSVLTKLASAAIERNLVLEADTSAPAPMGRPPSLLALNPSGAYVVGAHISAGRVTCTIVNAGLETQVRSDFRFPIAETSVDALIELVVKSINQLIETSGMPRRAISGVGVAVPGKIDRARRSNLFSKFDRWLQDVPFADRLEHQLALPVVLEHNATAMAMAEAIYGAGAGDTSALYLYMRSGLGAGLVHVRDGEAHSPGPIEIGHVVVEPGGEQCSCGTRGCLEARFSEGALLHALGLSALPEEGLIAAAMRHPEIWEKPYQQFIQALATAVTLLDPDLILLGGHLGEAPEEFVSQIRAELAQRLMRQFQGVRIERAHLVPDAGALGAACVALEKYFFEG